MQSLPNLSAARGLNEYDYPLLQMHLLLLSYFLQDILVIVQLHLCIYCILVSVPNLVLLRCRIVGNFRSIARSFIENNAVPLGFILQVVGRS